LPSSPPAIGTGKDLQPPIQAQSADSLRVYSTAEQEHLGAQTLGFVSFLESSGVLPPHMREIVVDRAMAAPGSPLTLDDLKIIVLMVYWSFGEEPDALVLDELCDDTELRVAH
jgi:Smg protein